MSKGAYIVVEGISGSGKTTLIQMLANELQGKNIPVITGSSAGTEGDLTTQIISRLIEDPRYPTTNRAEVLLYNAARAQSLESIRTSIEAGVTYIVDHSYLGTLVHEYYGRNRITDYDAANEIIGYGAGGLQPDLIVVLDTPVSIATERLTKISKKVDSARLERIRAGYLWEAKQRDIAVIYANEAVDTVFKYLQSHVSTVVTKLQPHSGEPSQQHDVQSVKEVLASHPTSVTTVQPKPLAPTTPVDPPQTSSVTAPVKPSTETTGHYTFARKTSVLAQQQLYGSVQPWQGAPLFTTNFVQKNEHNKYNYYIPGSLEGNLRSLYVQSMDQLFDTYSQLVARLTTHIRTNSHKSSAQRDRAWRMTTANEARAIAQAVLPTAATTPMTLRVSDTLLQDTVASLSKNQLTEVRTIGAQIAQESGITVPKKHEAATNSRMRDLANRLLPNTYADGADTITLTGVQPRNEFDLVPHMLYEYSDLPLRQLQHETSSWPYARKSDVFDAYLGGKSMAGSALETAIYTFDIVSEYSDFHTILQSGMVSSRPLSQELTPRIGFDTPELIEAAGLGDMFADCFDLSLELHSKLQGAGKSLEAQYATLLGHKLRFTFSCNARQALTFHPTGNVIQTQQALAQKIMTKISEVHPQLVALVTSARVD